MLSPAETLGLAGATLDSRVRRAANHVADATLARIADGLIADAMANELIYERDGGREAVRIMLRPLLAMPEQLGYVNHVCLKLIEALKRLPTLYLADERFRRILAITPGEEEWLRQSWTPAHERLNPVYGRLDAVCDFAGAFWRDSLQFMEPNLSGIGGINFTPVAEQLVMRDIVPTLQAHDPDLTIELPYDQREQFLDLLMEHAKAIGRGSCNLCLVEPKYVHEGPNEQATLAAHLSSRHKVVIAHADPRELEVRGEEVMCGDTRIDVIYRDYETRELIKLEQEAGKPLAAMRQLFRQNRVVSSLVGDFDHKSCWEVLTDPAICEQLFSMDECRLFRRHVLWTRVVGDRRTSLPREGEGDLLAYIRDHREQLVLKPNRSYGGTGVTLGASVEAGEWEERIEEALRYAEDPIRSWVVQAATRLPVHEFPVVAGGGRVYSEPFYAVMGFAPSENGLGTLCRVSQKQVVNVAQHGGLAALLVAHPPRELRISRRVSQGVVAMEKVRARIKELIRLDQVISLLGWDEETMLPRSGRDERGGQLASLEGMRHALLTSDDLGDLIGAATLEREGDRDAEREIALLQRQRRYALAMTGDLVRAFASAKSHALGAWEEAREQSNFALFAKPFDDLLHLARERARAHGHDGSPDALYDAALDEHEPGMTKARLDPVLAELKAGLVPLVREAAEMAHALAPIGVHYPEPAQWELCRELLTAMGFDFDRGRLDRSTHPFTLMAGFDDVRLTVRIDESDLTSAALAALHEGGHGLYDQGLDRRRRDTLSGESAGMGIHESQARLWENHVGRSPAFWRHLQRRLRQLFPEAGRATDAEMLSRAINRVQPGPNRVGADELTYHLHILLRYELEQALLSGSLGVADLPGVWNEHSRELLGITPKDDREGVLQDVHWSLGMIGYFPSYSIGSLYAAQLVEAYERTHDLGDEIGRGDFLTLSAWLRGAVHEKGNTASAEEIVAAVTGRGLDAAAYFRHARRVTGRA